MDKDKVLVVAVAPLLLYMSGWVWLYPASYLAGWWPAHDAKLERLISQPGMPTPSDVLSKYAPHTAVKLTHILPSGVWSLCAAVQLLPQLRSAAPRLHRVSGRVMSLCSALIVIGYALMESRGLVAAPLRVAAGGAGDDDHGGADDANPHHPALRLLSAWFILSAGAALVQARRGNYRAHRRWALRHIAAGGWVILQRLFVLGIAVWASAAGVAFSEAQRRDLFFAAASAAVVTSVTAAELYLWLGAETTERLSLAAAAATPPPPPPPPRRAPCGKADAKTC